jgi:hypothetical protein
MSIETTNEVRVKDELIDDTQSISDTRKEATLSNKQPNKITRRSNNHSIKHEKQWNDDHSNNKRFNKPKRQSIVAKKVKEEPKDLEIETSKEIEVKAEEKYSATEEFSNKTSIAFLNEETNTNQPTTSNTNTNNPRNKKSK